MTPEEFVVFFNKKCDTDFKFSVSEPFDKDWTLKLEDGDGFTIVVPCSEHDQESEKWKCIGILLKEIWKGSEDKSI